MRAVRLTIEQIDGAKKTQLHVDFAVVHNMSKNKTIRWLLIKASEKFQENEPTHRHD